VLESVLLPAAAVVEVVLLLHLPEARRRLEIA
jgi:hypothetical protein